MNYPVWYLPSVGGGTLIALIAVTHVFVSHFAVGGGLYLVLTELKARRENNPELLGFVRGHTKFFLILTLVFGSLSGVGIWFIIALVQPAGTSLLIHNFVFGWATEWVFFLVEIIAITIYYYTFDRMDPKTHLTVGWVYFAFAWLSLFIINGIITFMLTPGGWTDTGNFWAGFLNPTFWPSLVFRSLIAFSLAGVFAFLTTAFSRSDGIKRSMIRYSGIWALAPLVAALPVGWWYFQTLPDEARRMVSATHPVIQKILNHGGFSFLGLVVLMVVFAFILPRFHNKVVAFVMLALALASMGAFEWTRENARNPYVVNGGDGVLYSSGIWADNLEEIDGAGFLSKARWTAQKDVHEESLVEAGEDLFKFQCYACHTIGGLNKDILPLTAHMDYKTMRSYLDRIHETRYFMPPFAGTDQEARALSAFIVQGLHGKNVPPADETSGAGPGEKLFQENCSGCHPVSLVREGTADWDREKLLDALDRLNEINPAMPDFQWTSAEKEALGDYIMEEETEAGIDAGEDVFEDNCAMCHSLRGGGNPLLPKIEGWNRERIRSSLDKLPQLNPAMPPLQVPAEEKEALTEFLVQKSKGDR